jgi:hypothetical protein
MAIKKSITLIGTDVEVFIRNKNTKKYKSIAGLLGGTKDSPIPLNKDGCYIQEDGCAAEYNVPPVSLEDSHLMYNNIQYVIEEIRGIIPEEFEIECCSSASFEPDELLTPQSQEMGCDVDYNCWEDGMVNDKPDVPKSLRTCGGHIHISCPTMTPDESLELIKTLDVYLGVPSILIDKDTDRRTVYGKAGAFRFKYYNQVPAVEYRVLSNWWTKSDEYIKWVFLQIEAAIESVNNKIKFDSYRDRIIHIINTSDTKEALNFCEEFHINMPILIDDLVN